MDKPTYMSVIALLSLIVVMLFVQNSRLNAQLDVMYSTLNTVANAPYDLDISVNINTDSPTPTLLTADTYLGKKYALDTVNDRQLQRLVKIYESAQDTEYGLTLVSIAWKESRASTWPVNLNDPSCGPFHNKVVNVLTRESISDTPFNRNAVCGKLINNLEFSTKHALDEIAFWDKKHKGIWRKILASYNGGYKGNPVYAQEIAEIYSAFKNSNFMDLVDNSI